MAWLSRFGSLFGSRDAARLIDIHTPWLSRSNRAPSGGASTQAVRFDLSDIRSRLGNNWLSHGSGVNRITAHLLAHRLEGLGDFERSGEDYVIRISGVSKWRARKISQQLHGELVDLIFSERSVGEYLASPAFKPQRIRPRKTPWSKLTEWLSTLGDHVRALWPITKFTDTPNPNDGAVSGGIPITRRDQPAHLPPRYNNMTDGPSYNGRSPDRTVALLNTAASSPSVTEPPNTMGATMIEVVPTDRTIPAISPIESVPLLVKSTRSRKADVAERLRETRAIETAMMTATVRRRTEMDELDVQMFPPSDLQFLYEPLWNVKNRLVTTFASIPVSWNKNGTQARGDDLLPSKSALDELFQLDMLNLEQASSHIGMRPSSPRTLVVPLHLSVLNEGARWQHFENIMEQIHKDVRQRLMFEITDFREFRDQSSTPEILRRLSGCSRGLLGRTSIQDRALTLCKNSRLVLIGADIHDDQRPERQIIGDINRFALQAQHGGFVSYLGGLRHLSLLMAAIGAGINFVSGPLMGDGIPERLEDITAIDLLSLVTRDQQIVLG